MNVKELVQTWFSLWEAGDFLNLPISDTFRHTSPFGTIRGKKRYLRLVGENKDKFLGYRFELHDAVYGNDKACVRYTATQGDFSLNVSEWHYVKNHVIEEIIAYYHIGGIPEERKLSDPRG